MLQEFKQKLKKKEKVPNSIAEKLIKGVSKETARKFLERIAEGMFTEISKEILQKKAKSILQVTETQFPKTFLFQKIQKLMLKDFRKKLLKFWTQ